MKKLLVVFMAIMCAFCLTACGGKGGSDEGTKDTVTIKIGGSGPLTGDAAVYGEAVKNGASLAVDEINASDSKIKFELRMEDDQADGEKAVTAYNTLYDWGMQVSLFTVTSGSGAAVASMYDEDQIFAITPSGSSPDVVYSGTKNYKGNFQMCFTDPNQGIASADYIAQNFGGKKIGIIYKNDDVYSSGIYERFTAKAETNGLSVVYVGAFDNSNASDFNTQLTAAKAANVELLFLPIYYDPASLILTQANAMGYAPIFFGVDGMDGILAIKGFDTSLAEGVYLLTPFAKDSKETVVANFVKSFVAKYNEEPNQFAADAYDCVYAIYQAINNIGVDNIKADSLYADMIKQFTTMSFDGCTGKSMTWAENGEVSKAPMAVVITNGEYVSVQ